MIKLIKNYWAIIVTLLFVIGIVIDIFFKDAIPIKTKEKIFDGNLVSSVEIYTFTYKYELLKIISNVCYTLAISLIVLLALDVKLGDEEKQQLKNEREVHKSELENKNESIIRNVFDGVLKRFIQPQIFELIEQDILLKKIVRKNVRWTYEIETNQKGGYDVIQTISYTVHNISKEFFTEPIKVSTKNTPETIMSFEFCNVTQMGVKVPEKIFDKDDITTLHNTALGEVKSFPVNLEPNETIDVNFRIRNSHSSKNIIDHHFVNYPTLGLQIVVNKPSDCIFTIINTFSQDLKSPIPSDKLIVYDTINALLPGQGITYFISPSNK